MRTYLQARVIRPFCKDTIDLVLVCNCGQERRIADRYEGPMRPAALDSINTFLVAEDIAKFNYEHSACPDQFPEPASSGAGCNVKP